MGLDLSSINGLQTMAEINAEKRATPKHEMSTAREEKDAKRKNDEKQLDAWRKAVTKRDGLKCRWCRRKVQETITACPEQSQTHHATPREHWPTRHDPRNGIRLCGTCHDRITGTVGEKAIIVASATFTLDGRAYPDMSKAVHFKVIAERKKR